MNTIFKPAALVLAASLLGSASLSAGAEAQPRTNSQTQQAQPRTNQQAQPRQNQQVRPDRAQTNVSVQYYSGDPLRGGRLLSTVQASPQRGQDLFAGAPQAATFAVVTTPRGRLVVDLKDAAQRAAGPDGERGLSGRGGPRDQDGGRGMNGGRGHHAAPTQRR